MHSAGTAGAPICTMGLMARAIYFPPLSRHIFGVYKLSQLAWLSFLAARFEADVQEHVPNSVDSPPGSALKVAVWTTQWWKLGWWFTARPILGRIESANLTEGANHHEERLPDRRPKCRHPATDKVPGGERPGSDADGRADRDGADERPPAYDHAGSRHT